MAATVQLLRRITFLSKCVVPRDYRVVARVCVTVKPPMAAPCGQHTVKSYVSQAYHVKCIQAETNQRFLTRCCSALNSLHFQYPQFYSNTSSYSTSSQTQSNDSHSDKGNLVYMGRVGSTFKLLKIFSLTTSAIGLSLQPYLFFTYQDAPLVAAVPFFAALNIFVFVNPLLIHHIGKKYVMEVYFNPTSQMFTAVLMTFLARKYQFTFTANDVHVPDVPGMFSILTVKGRPLFVLESDFTDIEVYKHMMGFDKPLDLTFLKDNKQDKTE